VACSAGEVLALAALCLSLLALIVVFDGGGSLRAPAMDVLARLWDQVDAVTALALLGGVILAWALALALRAGDQAAARADRLARQLADSQDRGDRLRAMLGGRDELLLAVVHELRTPLTHMVGYAELLSSGARPRHPDEIAEMSAAIQAASTTMLRLMDDLVEATRVNAEGFTLKTRPIDLVQLIRALMAGYDGQSPGHRVTLSLPDHWLAVRADPERIFQVLGNLLTNAIGYSPAGGEITVTARQIGDRVRVEIADHGIGMDAGEQRRAFDRLYRASGGRAVREHGSGLGLAIVKDLIQAHGGEVGVTSQPGAGSTFWFTLPAVDDRAVDSEARVAARHSAVIVHGA
jgi:signal transduction histidine kinase